LHNPKVYIILVNYNGWKDTIECLESLLKLDYDNFQIVIVDNNSENNSMEKIKEYLDGCLDFEFNVNPKLKNLVYPLVKKHVPYVYYTKQEAENGNYEAERGLKNPIILIQSGHNGGFAFGNNIGIKYALSKNDFEYIWLLNNDTVVDKDALAKLAEKAEMYRKQKKKVGIIGSKILTYSDPIVIHTVGMKMNKFLAVAILVGEQEKDTGRYDNEVILEKIDSVHGASMFINKSFIRDVGLMDEKYFLYFEELDWCLRGKEKGYSLGYCWKSKVYHKEGSSTFSSKKISKMAIYYGLRNRILIAKKYYRKYLFFVFLSSLPLIVLRYLLIHKNFKTKLRRFLMIFSSGSI